VCRLPDASALSVAGLMPFLKIIMPDMFEVRSLPVFRSLSVTLLGPDWLERICLRETAGAGRKQGVFVAGSGKSTPFCAAHASTPPRPRFWPAGTAHVTALL